MTHQNIFHGKTHHSTTHTASQVMSCERSGDIPQQWALTSYQKSKSKLRRTSDHFNMEFRFSISPLTLRVMRQLAYAASEKNDYLRMTLFFSRCDWFSDWLMHWLVTKFKTSPSIWWSREKQLDVLNGVWIRYEPRVETSFQKLIWPQLPPLPWC